MPDISIIIPTCNRSKTLDLCLKYIETQDFDLGRAEVVVINDGGKDDTDDLIASKKNLPITYHRLKENKGPAAARNIGIKNSKADILVFLDDDCFVRKGWLAQVHHLHKCHPEILVIQGAVDIVGRKTLVYSAQKYAYQRSNQLRISPMPEDAGMNEAYFIGTGNLSVKRKCFDLLGPFDETLRFCEDRDFYYRLLQKGIKVFYCPAIEVQHQGCADLFSFFRKYYVYGKYFIVFHRKWQKIKDGPESCPVYNWDTYKDYLKKKNIRLDQPETELYFLCKNFGWRGLCIFLILRLNRYWFRLGKRIAILENFIQT